MHFNQKVRHSHKNRLFRKRNSLIRVIREGIAFLDETCRFSLQFLAVSNIQINHSSREVIKYHFRLEEIENIISYEQL